MKIKRPPYKSFPTLKNQRIILREIQEIDLQHLIEISFYNGIQATDSSDARIMNERIKKDYVSSNTIHWAITSVLGGEILGTCGFYRGFQENIGEIGYVLKKAHQGKGYMTEAVSLMVDFGWKELRLTAIKGVASQRNLSSINVLEKTGFKVVETTDDEIIFLILCPENLQR